MRIREHGIGQGVSRVCGLPYKAGAVLLRTTRMDLHSNSDIQPIGKIQQIVGAAPTAQDPSPHTPAGRGAVRQVIAAWRYCLFSR